MGLVETHPAHFVIISTVQDRDLVRLLHHLHGLQLVDERHWRGLTLVRRVRKRNAGQRHFAEFLDHRRRPRLQDRVLVIPDKLVVVANPDFARRQRRRTIGGVLLPARKIGDRPRADYEFVALAAAGC